MLLEITAHQAGIRGAGYEILSAKGTKREKVKPFMNTRSRLYRSNPLTQSSKNTCLKNVKPGGGRDIITQTLRLGLHTSASPDDRSSRRSCRNDEGACRGTQVQGDDLESHCGQREHMGDNGKHMLPCSHGEGPVASGTYAQS